MSAYSFGFLAHCQTLHFSEAEIVPLDNFDDVQQWVSKYKHNDGFFYPPTVVGRTESGELIPNTERPTHLHRVPASHVLRGAVASNDNDVHRTDASLIMQLVAYLYETWLQFEDWWFDARVPMRQHPLCVSRTTAEGFVSHSYDAWRKWSAPTQQRFVTTLFMFNRAPSYEWDWEHFAVEYMVFDALYKTATEVGAVSRAKGHSARIHQMCGDLGLVEDASRIEDLVRLRNDLLHEALWDGGQPGTARSGVAFMCQYDLRRLNQRLIPALLRYKNEFVSSNWWTMGHVDFGPVKVNHLDKHDV